MQQVRLCIAIGGDDVGEDRRAEQREDDKAPRRPSGFSLISRTPTSRKRERARCSVVRCANLPSTAFARDIISAFLYCFFYLYPLSLCDANDSGYEDRGMRS